MRRLARSTCRVELDDATLFKVYCSEKWNQINSCVPFSLPCDLTKVLSSFIRDCNTLPRSETLITLNPNESCQLHLRHIPTPSIQTLATMHLSTLVFVTLATALPTTPPPTNYINNASTPLTNFYLLTSPSPLKSPSNNSSLLSSVSATSLFDPLAQTNYLLRVIGPGYNSLPQFNLTDGTLETEAAGPHGVGEFEYNSTRVRAGEDLMFAPAAQPKGNLGLVDGYLLSVGGKSEGWRVCDGDLGQQVVSCFIISVSVFFFLELCADVFFCRLLGRAKMIAAWTLLCMRSRMRRTEHWEGTSCFLCEDPCQWVIKLMRDDSGVAYSVR